MGENLGWRIYRNGKTFAHRVMLGEARAFVREQLRGDGWDDHWDIGDSRGRSHLDLVTMRQEERLHRKTGKRSGK